MGDCSWRRISTPNFNVQQAERHLSSLPTSMVAQILGQATSAFETYD